MVSLWIVVGKTAFVEVFVGILQKILKEIHEHSESPSKYDAWELEDLVKQVRMSLEKSQRSFPLFSKTMQM
jgi:hypothetical protein